MGSNNGGNTGGNQSDTSNRGLNEDGSMRGLRDSGEVAESGGYGPAGAGGAALGPTGNQGGFQGFNSNEDPQNPNTHNNMGTQYSPELANAIRNSNAAHAEAKRDRMAAIAAQEAALDAMRADPNMSISQFSPQQGLNPTYGMTLGESLGYTGSQVAQAVGNMNAAAVGLGLLGFGLGFPGLGVLGYGFGQQDEDAPSLSEVFGNPVSTFGGTTEEGEVDDVGITDLGVNEFGNETFSMPAPSGIMGFMDNMFGMNNPDVTPIGMDTPVGVGSTTEQAERDFADRMANQGGNSSGLGLGSLFGPAPDVGPDRGGNRPLIPAENIDLDIDPEEQVFDDEQVQFAYNPTYSPFQFNPNTNSFGMRI